MAFFYKSFVNVSALVTIITTKTTELVKKIVLYNNHMKKKDLNNICLFMTAIIR